MSCNGLLFNDGAPSVLILHLTEADSIESLVETCGDRARLTVFRYDVFLTGVKIVNLTYGRGYGGSAYGSSLVESFKLVDSDVAAFHLDAHILGKLHEALVGD